MHKTTTTSTAMTPARASAIQSATAKANNGVVPANSFSARATRAAAINVKAGGKSK